MPMEYKGKIYARVSDILSIFVNFDSIDKDVLNRKAALGTRVHEAIQQEIEGKFPVLGFKERPYFQSFESWRSAIHPRFVMMEKRVYCDEKMITGCIDALIQLEGEDETILVDWKTSAQENAITWPMQAHLYYYLLKSSGIDLGKRFLFVKLDRNGNLPKVFQYQFNDGILNRCFQAIDSFWEKNVAIKS